MIEEKLVDILTQIETVSKTMAPEVLNAAIEVTRANGIINVTSRVFCLIISLLIALAIVKYYKFCVKKKKEDHAAGYCTVDWGFNTFFPCICAGVVMAIFLIESLSELADGWNYVAIFEPKLALARSIMEAASSAK